MTPGKGGQDVEGIPIFDTVAEAVAATGATASFVAVPPKAAPAAILEAAAAGIGFVVCITEGIPAQDEALVYNTLVRDHPGTRLLGPNCPGIISPGKCNIGITPSSIAQLPTTDGPNVGIVSRSGTLTYQALYELQQNGIGVSTCVGIGGDPVPGTSFVDCLAEFEKDPETHAIIMFGEIGGSAEEEAAEFVTANVSKPMSAYIAGVTAPAGKKMGHAGAIVSGGKGTAQGKMDALRGRRRAGRPQPDRGRRADGGDRQVPLNPCRPCGSARSGRSKDNSTGSRCRRRRGRRDRATARRRGRWRRGLATVGAAERALQLVEVGEVLEVAARLPEVEHGPGEGAGGGEEGDVHARRPVQLDAIGVPADDQADHHQQRRQAVAPRMMIGHGVVPALTNPPARRNVTTPAPTTSR